MSNQIKTQVKSLWKSLTNAEETKENSSRLITMDPIEGTPFKLCGNDETGYFIAFGKYRLTAPATKEEALNKLISEQYDIIARMTSAMIEFEKATTLEEAKELLTETN